VGWEEGSVVGSGAGSRVTVEGSGDLSWHDRKRKSMMNTDKQEKNSDK